MRQLCIFIIILLCTSCGLYWGEDTHDLCLKNNSEQKIAFYFPSTYDYSLDEFPCKTYPDTTISFPWWFTSGPVMPGESVNAERGLVEGAYEVYKADTLSLFILDYKLIERDSNTIYSDTQITMEASLFNQNILRYYLHHHYLFYL